MPLALGLGSGLALTLTLTLTLILTLTLTLTLTMTLTLTLTLTRPCLRWVGARAHRVQGASARILVAMRALANLGRSFTTPPPPHSRPSTRMWTPLAASLTRMAVRASYGWGVDLGYHGRGQGGGGDGGGGE